MVNLLMMLFIPIFATLITVVFSTNLFISILLFFGLPILYLAWNNRGIFKKSFRFALLLSFPLSLFVDVLAAVNGSWIVPQTIFPFRILGAATVEVYIYGLLWVLYAVLFYEHFFDGGKNKDRISPNFKYLVYLSGALVFYTILSYLLNKDLLNIPYFYLLTGIILVVIPLIIFLFFYPAFMRSYLEVGLYFFFVLFLFEIAALHTGQWIFPAKDFVGFIAPFGYRFPVEELIIWMSLATISLLSYYEVFADDKLPGKRKK